MTSTYRYGLEGPSQEHPASPCSDPLRSAFERWLREASAFENETVPLDPRYTIALAALGTLRPDPEEAAATVSRYADHPFARYAGAFLSACYARSDAKDIVYRGCGDLEPIDVGFLLPKGKALIIAPATRVPNAGRRADGPVLNLGTSESLCAQASGPVVNLGHAYHIGFSSSSLVLNLADLPLQKECNPEESGTSVGAHASGPVLNLGSADHVGKSSTSLVLNLGKANWAGYHNNDLSVDAGDAHGAGFALGRSTNFQDRCAGSREAIISSLHELVRAFTDPFRPDAPFEDLFAALRDLPGKNELNAAIRAALRQGGYDV